MVSANVTPGTSEVPYSRELSPAELDGVSGGMFTGTLGGRLVRRDQGGGGCHNDPCQMFQQIMQQMTQG
jgi:hypothetical protein